MKTKTDLRVQMDAEALERIWQWTDLARGEFSCLAQATDDAFVHDPQLFAQTCTSSSTDIDQTALAKFLCTHDRPETVRAWIHSHGKLGVFWSDQDDKCIEGLRNDTFLVSVVVNKGRDLKCRIDMWKPFRLTLDDLRLEVRAPTFDVKEQCERAFRALVTEVEPSFLLPTSRYQHARPPRLDFDWPGLDDELEGRRLP